ncbi:MAG: glutamate synthase subunit alpha, partial [Thermoleophilaceae bacterium]|nr:glutamate synthase subunit alpha [Thermoleophilaceae bacterium]
MRPGAAGLYDPTNEHDACGMGAVADLSGEPKHITVLRALEVLDRLEHRGAIGAEPDTGDGAGILLQIPDEYLRAEVPFDLPEPGRYGIGVCFLPRAATLSEEIESLIGRTVEAEGQIVLGWRTVPVDESVPGPTAAEARPAIKQLFIGAGTSHGDDQEAFERKLYVIRRIIEKAVPEE